MARLMAYHWPGNIRELYQVIEQIFAESVGAPTLYSIHLPQKLRISLARAGVQQGEKNRNPSVPALPSWKIFKEQTERSYMVDLMKTE